MNSIKLLTIAILTALALAGCMATNSGRVKASLEVTESFTTYQALDNYRYYYYGSQYRPQVLIGIHERYAFSSKFWREFDPKGEGLKKKIFYMMPDVKIFYNGYSILDPGGNPIGVWYSHMEFAKTATIKFGEDNQVTIYPPKERRYIKRHKFKNF